MKINEDNKDCPMFMDMHPENKDCTVNKYSKYWTYISQEAKTKHLFKILLKLIYDCQNSFCLWYIFIVKFYYDLGTKVLRNPRK